MPTWFVPPGYDPAAPTSPDRAGLSAFPRESVDPDSVNRPQEALVEVHKRLAFLRPIDSERIAGRLELMEFVRDTLKPGNQEHVDPDSVDGLIARLQALPADVRRLPVRCYNGTDWVPVAASIVDDEAKLVLL